ncbi:MAG TPA: ABC transporter ATP-binding protein, partial [Ornithinibacter sp.]|nr:ABC transporter ATP-binding protein [Ornithinibacter sp.]
MTEQEYDPTPVAADTAPEHLEAIATTDAVLELPPEKSGFGEGNVGEVLLDIVGLTKSFGSVRANRDISLNVRRGEIVALLGENGAGKSTLVNQIFGLITPDAGTVSVKGDTTPIKDPRDAIRRGIGMVHQHFQLVPVMTVAENMMLGHEPTRGGGVLDLDSARTMVRTLSEKHGLRVDPDAEVEDLPVGTQQRVEILKALSRKVDLLILDEPTAVLTPQETDELLGVMTELAASGTSIVFITHKLREVLAVSDRVYVLRQGAVVGEVATKDTDARGLATMMVGREVVLSIDKTDATPGESVLTIEDLHVKDDRDLGAVNGFSLEVRAGEIVGVAGVEGNGQRELVEALAGMRKVVSGRMTLGDLDLTKANPNQTHHAGVGHIPEDREKHGLVASYSIADNLVLNEFDQAPYAKGGARQFDAVRSNADALRDEFDIRCAGVGQSAGSLSGGNKQKVVVAREMSFSPKLLMAAQPTRGVDVGSIEFIHRRIVDARDAGAAVLLVSAELDEIL